MRRDAESPEVVRCTNMRGCTLPQQAPVAPEREGAGETVEGTAVVQRHFMRKYERRSTIESRSPVTANESDGRLEATEDEGRRLQRLNERSATMPSDWAEAPVIEGAENESRSKPGSVESSVLRQDIMRSNGRVSALEGSGSFCASGGSLGASELAKMLSGSFASSSSKLVHQVNQNFSSSLTRAALRNAGCASSSLSASIVDGHVEAAAEDGRYTPVYRPVA